MRSIAGALLLGLAPQAWAASCQIATTDLAFGQYRFDSDVDVLTEATVSIQDCVDDGSGTVVSYTISISPGGSASYTARAMTGPGGSLLYYNLFADPAHSLVWGDGSGGSATVSGGFALPGTTAASHTAFGRIPPHQSVEVGPYSDALQITIAY